MCWWWLSKDLQLIKAQIIRKLALSGTWISYSFLQQLRDHEGSWGRNILRGKFKVDYKETVFLGIYKYEFTAILKHAQEKCNLNSEKKIDGGRWAWSQTPTWRVIVNWFLIGDRKCFFFKRVAHGRWTILHWKGTHSRALWAAHGTHYLWYFKNNNKEGHRFWWVRNRHGHEMGWENNEYNLNTLFTIHKELK